MGQIDLFDIENESKRMTYAKLNHLNQDSFVLTNDLYVIELRVIYSNNWDHLTLLTYAKLNYMK